MITKTSQTDPTQSQFRWVVLLLISAVVLPTVCVLWFMGQAMSNVRSATRQEQLDGMSQTLQDLKQQTNLAWLNITDLRAQIDALSDSELFRSIQEPRNLTFDDHSIQSQCFRCCLIYDNQGQLRFPIQTPAEPRSDFNESQMFRKAWQEEFIQKDYTQAALEYERAARASTDAGVRLRANLGTIRCYRKAERNKEALKLTEKVLTSPMNIHDADLAQQITHLRIQWIQDNQAEPLKQIEYIERLLVRLTSYTQEQALLPERTRIYMLKKVIDLATPYENQLSSHILKADEALTAGNVALYIGEQYPKLSQLGFRTDFQLQSIDPNEALYGFQVTGSDKTIVVVLPQSVLIECIQKWLDIMFPTNVIYRLKQDDSIRLSWNQTPEDNATAITSLPLSDYFPGWQLDVLPPSNSSLDRLAREKINIYIRIGSLVISVMALLGLVLTLILRHQARLHHLKNDFIATVTHELKTPLASMRLLVDTLLEGRYRDQQQVTEYLQLVAKENTRLTGLIDNFLTFSRMERQKQAFKLHSTSARDIATDAIEAIKTKMGNHDCKFTTNIPGELPEVNVDHDALVTVLVNLFDNALKYSDDKKEIHFAVSEENNHICFSVQDDGWGIPRRVQRRIFDKFYQIDRSLSRKRDGCGLGLSIVKFIVDSHEGSIIVDSKVGAGSTFKVFLPIISDKKNG